MLKIMLMLAGHEFNGLRPNDLVQGLDVNPGNIHRDLENLRLAGWAERLPGIEERWRLGPKLIQVAQEYLRGIAVQEQKYQEILARYGRAI